MSNNSKHSGFETAGARSWSTNSSTRVCIVGAGPRFLSGITVYTVRLANALAESHDVSVILMRQLLPTRFYPGRQRLGADLTQLTYRPRVRVFDGVDWFWLPSILLALAFLVRRRPEVVIFQWWTGTVAHSYLMLALWARLLGARVVIEYHEVLDTGELKIPLARTYVRIAAALLVRLASGFTAHSQHDIGVLRNAYKFGQRPALALPHGPHDHYQHGHQGQKQRKVPGSCCNLLYFGVIRPYKGLEDLIRAFDMIPEGQINGYWLTIVGETWEDWTLPTELIARSRYRERITFINRYVHDDEVAEFFSGADAVVLPYHRSSMSGPLQVAMGYGLPVVVTRVGALPEAVAGYDGAILLPPQDIAALERALLRVADMRGKHFAHPYTWEQTAECYDTLFAEMQTSTDQLKIRALRI